MGSKEKKIVKFVGRLPAGSKIHVSRKPISSLRSTSGQKDTSKPKGFWYDCDGGWINWMSTEMPEWMSDIAYIYVVKVGKSGVLKLKSEDDILEFTDKYLGTGGMGGTWSIDWGKVASKYKGIEICPYQWGMRMDQRTAWYYTWDVASGCIWDSSAMKVELVGKWVDGEILSVNEIVASEMVRMAKELVAKDVRIGTYFKKASVFAPFSPPPKKYLRKMKISIADITPAQDRVDQVWVEKYAENPPRDLPMVVRIPDGRYIALNHTRIAGQVYSGKKMIDVQAFGHDIELPGKSKFYKLGTRVYTAESLMRGLLYVPRGVKRNKGKVEDAIKQIERAVEAGSIRKPEWQILSTTLSLALQESGENVLDEVDAILEAKRLPRIRLDTPRDLWRVSAAIKRINRYRGPGKKELTDWADGWLRLYMIMKRLKKEMLVSGRAAAERVSLDCKKFNDDYATLMRQYHTMSGPGKRPMRKTLDVMERRLRDECSEKPKGGEREGVIVLDKADSVHPDDFFSSGGEGFYYFPRSKRVIHGGATHAQTLAYEFRDIGNDLGKKTVKEAVKWIKDNTYTVDQGTLDTEAKLRKNWGDLRYFMSGDEFHDFRQRIINILQSASYSEVVAGRWITLRRNMDGLLAGGHVSFWERIPKNKMREVAKKLPVDIKFIHNWMGS